MTPEFFTARLVAKATGVHEEAEFDLRQVSPEDYSLLKPGAVFYWHIGYSIRTSGQRTNESVVRFRRLPAWQESEIVEAQKRAEKLAEEIGWGKPRSEACQSSAS